MTQHSTHDYQNQPASHFSCIHVLYFKLESNFFSRILSSIEIQLLISLVGKSCKTTLPLMKEISTGRMLLGRGKKPWFLGCGGKPLHLSLENRWEVGSEASNMASHGP